MNTEDNTTHLDTSPLDASQRLQLRGLRRDQEPGHDLWPGIVARIASSTTALPTTAAPTTAAPRRRGASRFAPWALAASLVLSLGFVWKMQPPPVTADPVVASLPAPSMHRQAEAMTLEYQAALRELQASDPNRIANHPVDPGLQALDLGATQIRTALEQDPDARFLLERLRRTYSMHLELVRRELTQRSSMS